MFSSISSPTAGLLALPEQHYLDVVLVLYANDIDQGSVKYISLVER